MILTLNFKEPETEVERKYVRWRAHKGRDLRPCTPSTSTSYI